MNLNNTVINIRSNVRKILKELEKLGYNWIDGTKPTHFIPEKDAKWIIIERNRLTYTCRSSHNYNYRDITADLLIDKKKLYND